MKSGFLKIFSCWSFYLPWNQLIKMRCTIGNPMAKAKNLIMVDFGLISKLVQVLFLHKSGSYFIISAFAVYTLQFAEFADCSTVWHNKQSNINKLKIMLCKQIVLLPKNVQYHCYWNCNWVSKCKKNIFNTFFLYLNYYSKGVSKSFWKFWLEITLKISNFFSVLLCF